MSLQLNLQDEFIKKQLPTSSEKNFFFFMNNILLNSPLREQNSLVDGGMKMTVML